MVGASLWMDLNKDVSQEVRLAPCMAHSVLKGINMTFHYAQMIHFFPNIRRDQTIRVVSYSFIPLVRCFTLQPSDYSIHLKDCLGENVPHNERRNQLFSVQTYRSDGYSAETGIVKQKQFIRIEWTHGPQSMCLSMTNVSSSSAYAEEDEGGIDRAATSLIRLQPCSIGGIVSAGKISSLNTNFMFQIEKVTVSNYFKT